MEQDPEQPSTSAASQPAVEPIYTLMVSRRTGGGEIPDLAEHVEVILFCAEGDYDVAGVMGRGQAVAVECWNSTSATTVRDILRAAGDLEVSEPVPANTRMLLSVYHRFVNLSGEALVRGLENRNPGLPRGGLIPISLKTSAPREGESRGATWLYVDVTPEALTYLESQRWSLKTLIAHVTLKPAPRARHRSGNA